MGCALLRKVRPGEAQIGSTRHATQKDCESAFRSDRSSELADDAPTTHQRRENTDSDADLGANGLRRPLRTSCPNVADADCDMAFSAEPSSDLADDAPTTR